MESTRYLTAAGMRIELVASWRRHGRWAAYVVSWHCLNPSPTAAALAAHLTSNWSASLGPSVNGSTSTGALDALEAELRKEVGSTWQPGEMHCRTRSPLIP
jgi:hypothetical protein